MSGFQTDRSGTMSAILIAPDRELAQQFLSSAGLESFETLLELQAYPSPQTLEIRLRQLQPEVVLVDVASDLEAAIAIVSKVGPILPEIRVVALDRKGGADSILRVLRAGANEFLYAPFDPASTAEVAARLLRLRKPDRAAGRELGSVCAFASVKPGSGASTLAAHTAFALRRRTSERVLFADLDLAGGTIGYYLKLQAGTSAVDALGQADNLNPATWTALVTEAFGVDILPAPSSAWADPIDTGALHSVLDYTRTIYRWVVLDLPVIFQRTSLMAIPDVDRTFLISTSELPSLHLARKSMTMLEQLGFPKDRVHLVVNRVDPHDEISPRDMEKLFRNPVHPIPNDDAELHRVVAEGTQLDRGTGLGKAIERLAAQLCAPGKAAGSGSPRRSGVV